MCIRDSCELDLNHIAQFFQAYEAGVMHRGKANINEKTFLDGIDPSVQSMRSSLKNHESLESFAQKAYEAACACLLYTSYRALSKENKLAEAKDGNAKAAGE